jgi:hypothetical protein
MRNNDVPCFGRSDDDGPVEDRVNRKMDDLADAMQRNKLPRVETNPYRYENPDGFFIIARVSREDVASVFANQGDDENVETIVEERARNLSSDDMIWLARKMGDDYINQLYWEQIRILAADMMGSDDESTHDRGNY